MRWHCCDVSWNENCWVLRTKDITSHLIGSSSTVDHSAHMSVLRQCNDSEEVEVADRGDLRKMHDGAKWTLLGNIRCISFWGIRTLQWVVMMGHQGGKFVSHLWRLDGVETRSLLAGRRAQRLGEKIWNWRLWQDGVVLGWAMCRWQCPNWEHWVKTSHTWYHAKMQRVSVLFFGSRRKSMMVESLAKLPNRSEQGPWRINQYGLCKALIWVYRGTQLAWAGFQSGDSRLDECVKKGQERVLFDPFFEKVIEDECVSHQMYLPCEEHIWLYTSPLIPRTVANPPKMFTRSLLLLECGDNTNHQIR